jgi:hypothetical protein
MGAIGTSVVDATAAEWRQATVCMASRPAGYQITDLGLMRRGRSCSLAPSITGAQVVLAQPAAPPAPAPAPQRHRLHASSELLGTEDVAAQLYFATKSSSRCRPPSSAWSTKPLANDSRCSR